MSKYEYSISKIDDILYHRIYQKSYKENCTIALEDLRYVTVCYYGFDKVPHKGELIVNKSIAEKVSVIFQELYDVKYPIEKICLVDNYNGDDNASMADNNSSCFNYRTIDGTTKLSNHSKGLAIDINPLYNPYIRSVNGKTCILPESGTEYADRNLNCIYMIKKGDTCYNAFIRHGFSWGGEWTSSKDYQHFELV